MSESLPQTSSGALIKDISDSIVKLDRQKYIEILKSEGLSAALTALHRDSERMEFESFEGRDGYRADLYAYLEEVRSFSRELWRVSMGETPRAT